MPALYSAAIPQPPESGAENVVVFSFPVTWTFLSQYTAAAKSEGSPEPRSAASIFPSTSASAVESPAELTEEPALLPARSEFREPMPEPLSPDPVVLTASDRSNGHAAGDRSAMDRWEMVVPKMSRPPARSASKFISQGPGEQTISPIPLRSRGYAADSQTAAEIHSADGRVSVSGTKQYPPSEIGDLFSTEIGVDFVAQARRMGHDAWRTLRKIPLPAILGGSSFTGLIANEEQKKR